jgi:hypothetical protein
MVCNLFSHIEGEILGYHSKKYKDGSILGYSAIVPNTWCHIVEGTQ